MIDIIISFPKIEEAKAIRGILLKNGYSVVSVVSSGGQAILEAKELDYGILISAYKFNDMLYQKIAMELPPHMDMLLICSKTKLEEELPSNVQHLAMPLKVYELLDSLEWLIKKQTEERKRSRRHKRVRSQADMEVIDKAKKLLMERYAYTEDFAHRYLQERSMNNGYSFVESAKMIISMLERKEEQ